MQTISKKLLVWIVMLCNGITILALVFLAQYLGVMLGGLFVYPSVVAITLWILCPLCVITKRIIIKKYFKNALFTINDKDEHFFVGKYRESKNIQTIQQETNKQSIFKDFLDNVSLFFAIIFSRECQKHLERLRKKHTYTQEKLSAKIGKHIVLDFRFTQAFVGFCVLYFFWFNFWNVLQFGAIGDILGNIAYISATEIDLTTAVFCVATCMLPLSFIGLMAHRSKLNRLLKEYQNRFS